jgi:hypothetical protein
MRETHRNLRTRTSRHVCEKLDKKLDKIGKNWKKLIKISELEQAHIFAKYWVKNWIKLDRNLRTSAHMFAKNWIKNLVKNRLISNLGTVIYFGRTFFQGSMDKTSLHFAK